MNCPFVVGQKVVFVDDARRGGEGRIERAVAFKAGAKWPLVGKIYHVREVFVSYIGAPAILLAEIDNSAVCKKLGKAREAGFEADRFRPVVEPGTEKGMSILRELLNKTDKPVEEVA